MSEYLNTFLFQYYPYIAFAVFAIGCWARYDNAAYTWRTGSSQLLSGKWMRLGSNWFHIGVLAILGGHFVGLLTPIWIFDAIGISHGAKQILAIVVGGIAGVACFIGLSLLIHRRLFDPRIRRNSSFSDIAVLLLLYAQLILGLATIFISLGHLDGEEMVKFMNWAQGIITLRPDAAAYVADVHPIFKAHLFLGLTIFLVFPFTRLVHMLSAPVWYLNRRGFQIVRTRKQDQKSVVSTE